MTSTCVCREASINAVFRAAGSIDLCERVGLRVEQLVDIGQTLARSPDMARFASGVKPRRSKPARRHGAQPLAAVQVGIHAGCAIASNCRRRSSNCRAAARSSRYRLRTDRALAGNAIRAAPVALLSRICDNASSRKKNIGSASPARGARATDSGPRL